MTAQILPGRPMPNFVLPMINEEDSYNLGKKPEGSYKLLVVYRGYHCPACKKQLESIAQQLEEFEKRKVKILALSCDDEVRAQKSADEWNVDGVPIAYDLPVADALGWGLFISKAIKDAEPAQFSEPGLFLLDKKNNVHAVWIQSSPFARPSMSDVLKAIDFIEENDYPPRGTVDRI